MFKNKKFSKNYLINLKHKISSIFKIKNSKYFLINLNSKKNIYISNKEVINIF